MAYSVNTFTIEDGEDTFDLSFSGDSPGYLDEDHVVYYIGEVAQGLEARVFNTPTNVTISPVPLDGTTISFRRHTSPEAVIVDWLSGSPITEVLLDKTNLQMLYLAQEAIDTSGIDSDAVEYFTDMAQKWAENPEDSEIESGRYSALHHAAKALASAITASSAATAASASETSSAGYSTSASGSASASAGSATAANSSAIAAAGSATSSAASATTATGQASAAQTFALAAQTWKNNAADSATAAGTSATNAAASATAASTSEGNAGDSETAAATSATNASGSATQAGTYASNASGSASSAALSAGYANDSKIAAAASATSAAASAAEAAAQIADLDTAISSNSTVAANTAKVSNVTTNLSFTRDASTVTVVSSDGTDAVLPLATTALAGLLSPAEKVKLSSSAASYTSPWI